MKEKTCLALFSGGLDSLLAVKVMQDQGIKVIVLNFDIGFYFSAYEGEGKDKKYKAQVPKGFDMRIVDISNEFYEMIKNPPHGYGKNMNPCIDCKILMLRKAKSLFDELGASFVITGEVLGQRPMTQNIRSMKIIEEESGLAGYLLRPLSAKCLPLTEPEKKSWVDRERLFDIQGRTRKRQLKMAEEYGLAPYVKPPAGGCILTEEVYSKRLKDLLSQNPKLKIQRKEMFLLTFGRHFRKDKIKLVIGRNEKDNEKLLNMKEAGVIFEVKDVPGPAALAQGEIDDKAAIFAASAAAGYADAGNREMIEVEITSGGKTKTTGVKPIRKEEIRKYMI